MPIYEYRCRRCGQEFERRRSFSDDDAEVECPKCGTKGPERVISRVAAGGAGESCAPSPAGG